MQSVTAKKTILSLKAQGLYRHLLSKKKPGKDLNYSIAKIMEEVRDRYDSVTSGIKELEDVGYLQRMKGRDGYMKYILYTEQFDVV